MLKLIGIAVVVYLGWVTGVIQATLMITAGVLIAIAGAEHEDLHGTRRRSQSGRLGRL